MSAPQTREQWQALADQLTPRNQCLIEGQWVAAASGRTFDCISPIDGRVITQVADGGSEDIDRAVRRHLKHLAENTEAFEIEYQRQLEMVKRKHGLE